MHFALVCFQIAMCRHSFNLVLTLDAATVLKSRITVLGKTEVATLLPGMSLMFYAFSL